MGQRAAVESLRVSVEAARRRGEPLDHVLLSGPPGLGKTTLATIMANEMQANIVTTAGPSLERGADLMGILTNLAEKDVLFIDEIHRLPRVVEELLYPAMEDFSVNFVMDKGLNARTIRIPLRPFTMVGATTRPGMLSSPLRERFGIFHHLDFYSGEELTAIINRSASILGAPIAAGGAEAIARRARGTPRIANRLLRRVRDYAQVKADGTVTAEVAVRALDQEGVDEAGLDRLDRRFLIAIIERYQGRTRGPGGHRRDHQRRGRDPGGSGGALPAQDRLRGPQSDRPPRDARGVCASGPCAARVSGRAGAATVVIPLGKMLLLFGLLMVLLGLVLLVAGHFSGKVPWLGRLPGDIYIQRGNWTFYFPLATCLIISVVLTLLFALFGRR